MIGYLCVVLVSFVLAVSGITIETHTFLPPFNEVDAQGGRMVSKYFRTGGSSEVFSNFVRLTPDRQSKKGAIWSRKPFNLESVTSVMKFRISGQGKTFFGDGIGMWFTNSAFWQDGSLHGSMEKFTGVGIIFDTFKNTENAAAHRDVTVLINDGEKTHEMMVKDVQGCNMNVRYHNERADFSVTDNSIAQVELSGDSLNVMVDAKGNGNFVSCVRIDNLGSYGLKPNWVKDSYLGITGSTGALADNHDVLSVVTATDGSTARQASEKKYYDYPEPGTALEDRIMRLENAINKLLMEHETNTLTTELNGASVDDKIANILGKLSKREDAVEQSVDRLQDAVASLVESHMEEHHDTIDANVKRTIDSHRYDVANQIHNNREQIKAETLSAVMDSIPLPSNEGVERSADGGGYMWAFIIVSIMFIAGLFIAYNFYNQLKKKHFL